MYRNFFGLSALPFKTTPELQMFYKDGSRQQILEALLYTVQRGDGIIKVTGEVGSGKTMLLRLLSSKLPSDTEIIYINSPNLSAKDILLYICTEINIDVSGFREKFSLTNALKEKLVELHASGKRVVMLVDEAQAMTFDALEELRLLSNLETSDDKLLQMVLFGQPELDVAMENEKIRQIKSRISYSIYVPPLTPDEVYEYLNYRMRQAGYTGLDVFTPKISKKIQAMTDGLPRSINVIADKVLMSCFGTGDKVAKTVHIKDLGLEEKSNNFFTKRNILIFLLFIIFSISLFLFFFLQSSSGSSQQNLSNQAQLSNGDSKATQVQKLPIKTGYKDSSSSVKAIDTTKVEVQVEVEPLEESNNSKNVVIESVDVTDTTTNLPKDTLSQTQEQPKFNSTPKTNQNIGLIKVDSTKLDEPFLSLYKRSELQYITKKYLYAKTWLTSEDSRYVIQLSTRPITSLESTVQFYKQVGFDLDQLYFLIDFNQKAEVYRIKVFYYPLDSFSKLSSVIARLPKKVRQDGPYVVSVPKLKNKLIFTDQKLKEIGISNE